MAVRSTAGQGADRRSGARHGMVGQGRARQGFFCEPDGGSMSKKEPVYKTLEEASAFLRMPESTLRKKIAHGELAAYKPGRAVLIEQEELELFVKKNRVNSAS